ncbi:MAG: hypothetical protein ACRYF2_01830 [Janthinobacterium lividum]
MGQTQTNQDIDGEDILLSAYGTRYAEKDAYYNRHRRKADRLFDAWLKIKPSYRRLTAAAERMTPQRIHVAGVDVPSRRHDLDGVLAVLKQTRHDVSVSLAPIGDRGKFTNINLALAEVDLDAIDWLIVTDDDIDFPAHFLDRFVYACFASGLRIAQPAHRFESHTTWTLTQRRWNSLVHTTHMVECGPLTIFHRDVFADVLPFPETRWAWGLDVLWGELARRRGLPIGIVDATPIAHLRPVAQLYEADAAVAEGRALLAQNGVARSNREILKTTAILTKL